MVRRVLLASMVLAAPALSAVLLAWPGDSGEIVGLAGAPRKSLNRSNGRRVEISEVWNTEVCDSH